MQIRLLVTAFIVLLSGNCRADAIEFRVCIGEYEDKCPVSKDAMFGCGTTFDQAATSLCAITVDGQKKVSPYRVIPQGTHDGNRCGYSWGRIQCLDDFPTRP